MKKIVWTVFVCLLLSTVTVWAAPVRQTAPVLKKQLDLKELGVSGLTLTSPGISETWRQGTTRNITWTYKGKALASDTVKIELFYAEKLVATLAKNHPIGGNGMGSFVWKVPDDQPIGAAYMIVITSERDAVLTAKSNLVFIDYGGKPQGVSDLKLTSPGISESWRQGTTHKIAWTYKGAATAADKVKIELSYAYKPVATLATNYSIGANGNGSFNWSVPKDLPIGAAYMITVTSEKDAALTAKSNFFFVDYAEVSIDKNNTTTTTGKVVAVANKIKLTSPNGGEVWRKGRNYNITWDYTGNPKEPVVIAAVPNDDVAGYIVITQNAPVGANGKGSYSWTIPDSVKAGTNYKIHIGNGKNGLDFMDVSDASFTISESVNIHKKIDKKNKFDPYSPK